MRCERKFVFPLFASFLIMTALASVSEAKTIYVPDDYARIQWAVDNASDGDTIIVRDRIYYESITVSKHLTIKSENGSENCIVNGTGSDVFTLEADGIRIEGFTITGGRYGIYIRSNSNKIINNNIISNYGVGSIYLDCSNNNSISDNNISNNWLGMELSNSNNNRILKNNISNNVGGIFFDCSNNNSISENIISSNSWHGIFLWYSNKTMIRKNEFINDGLFVYDSYSNIVEDNKVNGKPLVYLENESDKIIDNAGQVILVRCKNITITNAELTNTDVGIELFESDNCLISNNNISKNKRGGIFFGYSNNNSISNNNISNNEGGIFLGCSNNNSILENIISSNNYYSISLGNSNKTMISKNNISNNRKGICLWYSNNNIIYLNNFINNTESVYSYNSTNIWNSKEPITYTYRGSKFTNYMGNYWDDYKGSDANGDGIGDTPHIIDSDKDYYPLIERFENYFVETPTPTPAKIFDTGRPENPYPSISGKFIGTIRTNTKIIE